MSKDDAHYAPHTTNPFKTRFRDASAKITHADVDAFVDVLDMASPRISAPPPTPMTHYETVMSSPRRRCQSLPGSPSFDATFQFDFSAASADLPEWTEIEDGECEESSECGTSSIDSGALELDTRRGKGSHKTGASADGAHQGSGAIRLTGCRRHDELVALCLECVLFDGSFGCGDGLSISPRGRGRGGMDNEKLRLSH